MFSVEERDRVRRRLLTLAEADPGVSAAAITGSYAGNGGDRWSDIDLALAIAGPLDDALAHWTGLLYNDFGALHHWDLPHGRWVYRVFLLPDWLEADLAFAPADDFGPAGPTWHLVFGDAPRPESAPRPPDPNELAGLAWHHALHARIAIERHQAWQAEYWIGALRNETLALACLRLGHPIHYAKGAHLLPAELTTPLEPTLVRSLDEAELRRALDAGAAALAAELARTDPAVAARLRPVLAGLAAPMAAGNSVAAPGVDA